MTRLTVAAGLLITACAPWSVVQRAEPNPLAGQKTIAVLPLDWSEVMIDGLTEQAWDDTNDAAMKREWVADRALAAGEFQNGLYGGLAGKLQIVPGAAPFTIKSSATFLKTGGLRPLILTVRAQLIGPDGRVLDEIEIEKKESKGGLEWGAFRKRLLRAAFVAGDGVAEFFAERASD